MIIGKTSASPVYFHVRRPPKRKDTSAKPSRSTRRATTEASAGANIRGKIHKGLRVTIITTSKIPVIRTTAARNIANPRRAWRRL